MDGSFGARAATRDAPRPCTLSCTRDGVWLWPGTTLTEKRNGTLIPRSTPEIYASIATLHGVGFHTAALMRGIERAVSLLNCGHIGPARQVLADISLPPISGDGAALMSAIGRRLDIAIPKVAASLEPSYSRAAVIDELAKVHDSKAVIAQTLAPIFNPDLQRVAPGGLPFDPSRHPRWPAGAPRGGEFRPGDGGGDDGPVRPTQARPPIFPPRPPVVVPPEPPVLRPPIPVRPPPPVPPPAPARPPGIGHNEPPEAIEAEPRPPVSEPAYELPPEPAPGPSAIYLAARGVSRQLGAAIEAGKRILAEQITNAVHGAEWLERQVPSILSAQDPPKDLGDLLEAARQPRPHPGYEVHHIVERSQIGGDISEAEVEADDNKSLVPYYKHRDISNYYQTPGTDRNFSKLSPREAMRGRSFQEQYEYGLRILREHGVLK
jgi:hypothetical protein